ncbi:SAG-related sequence [Besnoitia besnoiti]|uniref:SAG-related sequence n=1 Tax=Besnoitia besnoiti TaxID=94643 RepID=A0A2A9MFY1_BESBE|nr:SAG-related sequence [Besnoitia besnoiti]PFH36094.1 SAG-related sequence [Besnoitia besnoiti]
MKNFPGILRTGVQVPLGPPLKHSQGKSRLTVLRGSVFFVVLAGTVLLYGNLPFSPTDARADAAASSCEVRGNETTCTCEGNSEVGEPLLAVISRGKNTLKLDCKGDLKYAPDELKTKVCVSGNSDLKCSTDPTPTCFEVDKLLYGSTAKIQWTDVTTQQRAIKQPKSLTIPPENLPYVDVQFVVGCLDSTSNETPKCIVAATVEARASVADGQTVTCAYGASSNTSRQAVTLSPSKNSFTLVCGDKGTVLPTNYDTKFCSSDPKDKTDSCDGDYQSILPGFESSWWKKEEPSANSFTLSIPVEKFPNEPAKMVVACQLTKQNSGSQRATEDEATSSVCKVDVTIEAGGLASVSVQSGHSSSWLVAFAVTFVIARCL